MSRGISPRLVFQDEVPQMRRTLDLARDLLSFTFQSALRGQDLFGEMLGCVCPGGRWFGRGGVQSFGRH
jgi:hypothetical protein